MNVRQLLGACFIAAVVAPAAAQSAATKGDDQISGRWGMNGLTFLDLKFDGEKTLTGTVYWRHDSDVQQSEIKSGSFDRKTNAFTIEGEAPWPPNGPAAKYSIKGKLDKDTIAGTYSIGDNNGQFTFTRLQAAGRGVRPGSNRGQTGVKPDWGTPARGPSVVTLKIGGSDPGQTPV